MLNLQVAKIFYLICLQNWPTRSIILITANEIARPPELIEDKNSTTSILNHGVSTINPYSLFKDVNKLYLPVQNVNSSSPISESNSTKNPNHQQKVRQKLLTEFELTTYQYLRNTIFESKKPWYIMFYAHWCGYSQKYANNYQNLLKNLYNTNDEILNKINFGSLDCEFIKTRDHKLKKTDMDRDLVKMCFNFMKELREYHNATTGESSMKMYGFSYPKFKIIKANIPLDDHYIDFQKEYTLGSTSSTSRLKDKTTDHENHLKTKRPTFTTSYKNHVDVEKVRALCEHRRCRLKAYEKFSHRDIFLYILRKKGIDLGIDDDHENDKNNDQNHTNSNSTTSNPTTQASTLSTKTSTTDQHPNTTDSQNHAANKIKIIDVTDKINLKNAVYENGHDSIKFTKIEKYLIGGFGVAVVVAILVLVKVVYFEA